MIIRFSEIEDGAILKGEIEGTQLTRAEDSELTFLAPIDYKITMRKLENSIEAEGSIRCSLSLICGRCLDSFPFQIDAPISVELVRKTPVPDSELELTGEEMDVYYFEGDEIDLDQLIYEEVLLNIPMKTLCGEDCKGLCPICGKNNNIEACHCDKASYTLLEEKLNAFLSHQGDNHGSSKKKNFSVKKG